MKLPCNLDVAFVATGVTCSQINDSGTFYPPVRSASMSTSPRPRSTRSMSSMPELSVSCPGDEVRDDDDLGDEVDQGAVRFTIAQTLQRDSCTQHEIRGFFPGHR